MRFPILIGVIGALLVIAAVIGISIYTCATRQRWQNLEVTCEHISRWAKEQPLATGAHPQCQVPASLCTPPGSQVNLVKTLQGDIVVLLKTSVGWKGNYEGVLYSTKPFEPADITTDSYGREEIAIPGIDNNPPVIRSRLSPRFF